MLKLILFFFYKIKQLLYLETNQISNYLRTRRIDKQSGRLVSSFQQNQQKSILLETLVASLLLKILNGDYYCLKHDQIKTTAKLIENLNC